MDITHVVKFDDSQPVMAMDRLIKKADELNKKMGETSKDSSSSLDELADSLKETTSQLVDTTSQVSELNKSVETHIKTNDNLEKSINSQNKVYNRLKNTLGGISLRLKQSAKGFKDKAKSVYANIKALKANKKTTDDTAKSATGLRGRLSGLVKGFGSAAGGAVKSAAKFAGARVAALGMSAALGVVGVVVAALGSAFARSQKIVDAFNVVMAQVNAVVDVFADRIASAGEVILSVFTGETSLSNLGKNLKDTFKGINQELETEVRLAKELEKATQRITREELNLSVQRSAANSELKKLNFTIEDTTKSYKDRVEAAKEADKIETRLLSTAVDLNNRRAAIALGETKVTDEVLKRIEVLKQEGFAWTEAEKASGDYRTSLEDLGLSFSTIQDARDFVDIINKGSELEAASFELRTTNNNKLNTLNAQIRAEYLKGIAERKKAEEDLSNFRLALADRLKKLELDNSSGIERINLEKEIAEEEINQLEKVAKEKFKALNKQFDLDKEFSELRDDLNKKTEDAIRQYRLDSAREEITQSEEIELAKLEVLKASEDEKIAVQLESLRKLRKIALDEFGEGSIEVLEIDVNISNTLDEARSEQIAANLAGLEELEKIALAEVDLTEEKVIKELSLEKNKERSKLIIMRDGLEKRRALISAQFGEDSAEVQLLDIEVDKLQKAIDDIDSINLSPIDKIKNKIKDALNLSDSDFSALTGQVQNITENIISGFESLREARLAAAEQEIERIDEQIAKLNEDLAEQEELERLGLANSAQSKREALEEETEARREAEAERLKIEKAAAKQRLVQEGLQMASSYALAVASLVATEASKGIVGIALAVAGAATIFAIIAKARANAKQFAEPPEFAEGGRVKDGLVIAPSHKEGGANAYYKDIAGRTRMINLEGNEFVVNKDRADEYDDLLRAVNTGKINDMEQDEVSALFQSTPAAPVFTFNKAKDLNARGRLLKQSGHVNHLDRISGKLEDISHAIRSKSDYVEIDNKVYKVDHSTGTSRLVKANIPKHT